MILTANGFAIVKYNGLFSIFALLALPAASELSMAPLTPPTKLCSLDTYHSVCPLRLCYSLLGSLLDFCWALCLLHVGISRFLPLAAVYNFFPIFTGPSYPLQASDVFFYFLKLSKSIRSIASIANTNFKSPAVPLDLEALQTQFVQK